MPQRRFLVPLALLLGATTAAVSCTDQAPVGVQTPTLLAALSKPPSQPSKNTGLVACSQSYDSVTKVIGPLGGTLAVGAHQLWVDSLSLTDTVRITAVAPAGGTRWVRFRPDGLVFKPGFYSSIYGINAGAALYTSYKDCAVATTDMVRIAQVSDSLSIMAYLQTWVQVKKNPWSQGNQYVVGVLPHFSNYAVAW
ncbi:MAG TPA: hypothetical protein VGQ29_15195 [Gemmatimonadales bacterium]|jgi:hypothetical protein|nr:hypothetical protein [Gemmatimonadales bacterium]